MNILDSRGEKKLLTAQHKILLLLFYIITYLVIDITLSQILLYLLKKPLYSPSFSFVIFFLWCTTKNKWMKAVNLFVSCILFIPHFVHIKKKLKNWFLLA
uniref:Uncharacterized protein n=1 Tax=Cacopsylla melanoneura TaxID=428564 RepID=A0A8D9FDI0_9HEMI